MALVPLIPCARCGRHLREGSDRCPFCALAGATKRAAALAAAAVVGVGLSACYGGPSRRDNLERYDRDAYPPPSGETTREPAAPSSSSATPSQR